HVVTHCLWRETPERAPSRSSLSFVRRLLTCAASSKLARRFRACPHPLSEEQYATLPSRASRATRSPWGFHSTRRQSVARFLAPGTWPAVRPHSAPATPLKLARCAHIVRAAHCCREGTAKLRAACVVGASGCGSSWRRYRAAR